MDTLPTELLSSLFAHCAPKQVVRLASTCRSWQLASQDAALWRGLAAIAFGKDAICGDGDGQQLFREAAWTQANWRSLAPSVRVDRLEGEAHTGMVTCVATEGELLVSGGNDCVVRLWDLATHTLKRTFRGHLGAVSSLLLDLPRDALYSGSWDKSVRCWDVRSGECVSVCELHRRSVVCLQLLGDVLVSGGGDGRVIFWQLPRGAEGRSSRRAIGAHVRSEREDTPVLCLRAAPQTSRASGGAARARVDAVYADGSVRRWEVALEEGELPLDLGGEHEIASTWELPAAAERLPAGRIEGPLRHQPTTIAARLAASEVLEIDRSCLRTRPRPQPTATGGASSMAASEYGGEQSWEWRADACTLNCLEARGSRITVAGARQHLGVVIAISERGEALHSVALPSAAASLASSADGARLFVGCGDGVVRVLDYSMRAPPPHVCAEDEPPWARARRRCATSCRSARRVCRRAARGFSPDTTRLVATAALVVLLAIVGRLALRLVLAAALMP
uniref:F-box domain-containing protein n=1 Tax=Calcidiscus leptoporus TaxID=127549 RepID=A0A7S0IZV8_9EUKA